METRELGRSGIHIAPLMLGGNVFGWTADEATSHAVLDAFVASGFNAVDTADVYSAWVPGHTGGESETVIGTWLKKRGKRDDVVIATKVAMWPAHPGLRADNIVAACEDSLKRLQTDYIDLYQSHKDEADAPQDETAEAYGRLVRAGKVRELGVSNISAERLSAALDAADSAGATPFTVLQNQYNLVARDDYGPNLQRLCTARGIAMLPFFGLASGYLTGKYRKPEDFEQGNRSHRVKDFDEAGRPVLAEMDRIAAETGASLPAIALAWLVRQPGIPAPIASARTVGQLQQMLEFTQLELSEDQLARLTAAGS
jgi:aryl-alcohol dehydrogenase-like predicted oxidoreductase